MNEPLPIVDGVGPSRQWLPSGPWKTVVEFLENQYPQIDAATWNSRIAKGHLIDDAGHPIDGTTPYRPGACIFYYRELENEATIPFAEDILYQDEHILVADKPHFLPVIPAGRFLHETLLVRLRRKGAPEALVPVHRLDRETAGVVLFSLNPKTRSYYTALFRDRKVNKIYEALAPLRRDSKLSLTRISRIVQGEPFFRMKEIPGSPNSETHIAVVDNVGSLNLYQLRAITGRKHQLRLHMAALEIPVINDKLYPVLTTSDSDDFSRPLKLLARSISFQDPVTGRRHFFESSRSL